MKKILFAVLLITLICATAFAASSFKDVNPNHWAVKAIQRWADEKIVVGYPDNNYKPEDHITRAEFCAMLCRIFEPAKKADLSKFTDVKEGAWYVDAMSRCLAAGYIDPISSTILKPNGLVSRQDTVMMLNAIFEFEAASLEDKIKEFSDGKEVGNIAVEDVEAFLERGILLGYEDNTLRINDLITRAEASTLFDRLIAFLITAPGKYDVSSREGVVIVKADDVKLVNAKEDAQVIYLNDEVKASTTGVTDAEKKESTVINPDAAEEGKEEEKPAKKSSGTKSTTNRVADTVITLTSTEDNGVKFYTVNTNGEQIEVGKTLSVVVDGSKKINAWEVTENGLLDKLITLAKGLDSSKVINSIDRGYGDDADVNNWGLLTIKECFEDSDAARYVALAAVAHENEDHKIKAVFDALTSSEKDAVKTKALDILKKALNNEHTNADANNLVTIDYILGKLNSANVI